MRRVAVAVAYAALLAVAAPAQAHIDVLPTTLTQGEATELTVRVPTERDLPTTRVSVDVPAEVTVYSVGEPPPGWTVTAVKGPDGRIASVVWSGGSIPPGRYADFTVLGTPFTAGEAVWPARQTYGDGQVKPWTGPAGEEAAAESGPTDAGPAPRTTIAAEGTAPAATAVTGGDDDSGAAIWLGVIAIVIAALAALGTGLLWSSRPARLPEDEEPSL